MLIIYKKLIKVQLKEDVSVCFCVFALSACLSIFNSYFSLVTDYVTHMFQFLVYLSPEFGPVLRQVLSCLCFYKLVFAALGYSYYFWIIVFHLIKRLLLILPWTWQNTGLKKHMDLPAVKLLCLEQENCALEDHIRDVFRPSMPYAFPGSLTLCIFPD